MPTVNNTKKLRLLILNPFWDPYVGGIEKTIQKQLDELEQYDEVEAIALVTSYNNHPKGRFSNLPPIEQKGKVTIYRLNFLPRGIHLNLGIVNGGFFAHGFKRVIKEFNPNVVKFETSSWYIPNLLAYLYTKHTAKHCYELIYHDPRPGLLFGILGMPKLLVNRYLSASVDSIVALTKLERGKIAANMHIDPEKVEIVPLGVDLPDALEPKPDALTILCVGRIEPGKGQYRLIKIVQELNEGLTKNAKLILVGADGGDQSKIETYIRDNNLTDQVELLGQVSDEELHTLYATASIFALPSSYEAFGLVYLEAMAYKTPVVTYDIPAVLEVLDGHAMTVGLYNDVQFLKALRTLATDTKSRLRMGDDSRKYALKYSWKQTNHKLLRHYLRLLSTSSTIDK